jgi:hypothetical protein
MGLLVSLRGIWKLPELLSGFLGELWTEQGVWLKLLMREEKRGLLSPQVLILLWVPLEVGVPKAWVDKLGHMLVGTGQAQPGALGEDPFLSFPFF